MCSFTGYIFTALALVLVIEGLLYALFPDTVRKMFAIALMMPVSNLRITGMAMAGAGLLTVWFLRLFSGG